MSEKVSTSTIVNGEPLWELDQETLESGACG